MGVFSPREHASALDLSCEVIPWPVRLLGSAVIRPANSCTGLRVWRRFDTARVLMGPVQDGRPNIHRTVSDRPGGEAPTGECCPTGAATSPKGTRQNEHHPHPEKKLLTSALGVAAALAAPAVLFFGAGTAQAADVSWAPGFTPGVTGASEYLTITVTDDNQSPATAQNCVDTALPEIGPAELLNVRIYIHGPFSLAPGQTVTWTTNNDGPLARGFRRS